MIVDSPFARRGPTQEAIPPAAPTADSVLQQGTETGSGQVQNRAPIAKNLQDSGSSSIPEGLDEFEARPLFTRIRVILGLVALVLAAAVIAVFYRPTHISKRPIPPLQEQTGTAESPDNGTPVTPQPEAKTGQPESETAKPAAKSAAAAAKPQPPARPQADHRAKNKKDAKDSAEQPEVVEDSGGLSQIDIPKLLDFANTDTGNGRYENARLEYRKVLKLQPNNQEAKEGLKKLDRIQSDRQ
jgi:cytoskeletal protein RodZ